MAIPNAASHAPRGTTRTGAGDKTLSITGIVVFLYSVTGGAAAAPRIGHSLDHKGAAEEDETRREIGEAAGEIVSRRG